MRILADENIPRMTVEGLRALGHDVRDVRGTSEQGLADADLWRTATTEARMLITTDKGFAGYRRSSHHGILIVRLRQPNRHRIHNAVMQAMAHIEDGDWRNLLVVVRDATMSMSRPGGPAAR